MTDYTVLKTNAGIIQCINRDDGACIPVCEGNSDYIQYLEDVAEHGDYPVEILPIPEASRSLDSRVSDVEQYLVELALGV